MPIASRATVPLILALTGLGLASLSAQTFLDPARAATSAQSDGTEQALRRQQQAASAAGLDMENAFAPPSPGDSDLGRQIILKRNEKAQPFAAWLDSNVFWTDNVANVREAREEDWFYVGGINLGWQQRVAGRFFADAYLGEHWFRYDEFSELDYETGEASLGGLVVMPELANSILHAHYYYQRITQGIGDSPIYETHNVRVGAQKTFLINRLNSANVSLMSSFALDTDPDVLRRHEHSLMTGYNFKITRKWLFSLSYRLAYYDYFNLEGRADWYQNLAATLTWRPSEHVEFNAGYNYTINRSNYGVFDYDAQLAGPGLALKIKF